METQLPVFFFSQNYLSLRCVTIDTFLVPDSEINARLTTNAPLWGDRELVFLPGVMQSMQTRQLINQHSLTWHNRVRVRFHINQRKTQSRILVNVLQPILRCWPNDTDSPPPRGSLNVAPSEVESSKQLLFSFRSSSAWVILHHLFFLQRLVCVESVCMRNNVLAWRFFVLVKNNDIVPFCDEALSIRQACNRRCCPVLNCVHVKGIRLIPALEWLNL